MIKLILLGVLAAMFSGCSGATSINQDLSIVGTAEGIRAYNDGIIGIARTSKELPEADSKYFAHRQQEDSQVTNRVKAVSFWGKLVGGDQ